MRRAAATLAVFTLFAASVAAAHIPPRAEAFSAGLVPRGDSAGASGVIILRPPAQGRVWLGAGSFAMGSEVLDLWAAKTLCEREPFGKTFARGRAYCDEHNFQDELPRHRVRLDAFAMDRTETSVGEYDRCVSAGACGAPAFRRGDRRFDQPDLPVTMVRWEDAFDYCKFAGGRLPTEAEWEYAARGSEGRAFPWGNIYNDHLCNHGSLADDSTDASDGFAGLAPVGSFHDGATPTGIFDLAGNVEEWVADRVEIISLPNGTAMEVPYDSAPTQNPFRWVARGEPNPLAADAGNTTAMGHYARGGSYRSGGYSMRAPARSEHPFGRVDDFIGFRCVYETP